MILNPMKFIQTIQARLSALFRKKHLDSEMDAETHARALTTVT
jgi:hypothetical protein